MAASKAGSRRQVLPFPSSNRDKQNALKKHQEAQRRGLPIPHFKKKDGSIHYFDNKGNGYRFNDLATKLANEAARKANKTASKPTLEHYTEAYGSKLGKQLFDAEQQALKKAYRHTPSATHDVDHINSSADGGVHHSSNLRAQNKSNNRSQGARGLTAEQKIALKQADNPKDQIRLQGPNMTPYQRQAVINGNLTSKAGTIGYVAKQHDMPKATWGGRQELLLEQETPLPKPMGTAPTQRQVAGDLLQRQAKLAANRFGIIGIGLAD